MSDESTVSQVLHVETYEQRCLPEVVSEVVTRYHARRMRERRLNYLPRVSSVMARALCIVGLP
jgi:hypothetical protein